MSNKLSLLFLSSPTEEAPTVRVRWLSTQVKKIVILVLITALFWQPHPSQADVRTDAIISHLMYQLSLYFQKQELIDQERSNLLWLVNDAYQNCINPNKSLIFRRSECSEQRRFEDGLELNKSKNISNVNSINEIKMNIDKLKSLETATAAAKQAAEQAAALEAEARQTAEEAETEDPYATIVVSKKSKLKYQLTISSNFYEEELKISAVKKGYKTISFKVKTNDSGKASIVRTQNLSGFTLKVAYDDADGNTYVLDTVKAK